MLTQNKNILRWQIMICTTACLLFGIVVAQAATKVDLSHASIAGLSSLDAQMRATASPKDLAFSLGLTSDNEIHLTAEKKGKNNFTYRRYQQRFKGIPVWGENIIIIKNGGKTRKIRGTLIKDIASDLETTVTLVSPADELRKVKNTPQFNGMEFRNELSQQVIFIDEKNIAHLATLVNFFVDGAQKEPRRPNYIIDANTGEILLEWDGLTHAKVADGPGGNVKTGEYYYGTILDYLDVAEQNGTCTMETDNVKTIDLRHRTRGRNAYSFPCYTNTHEEINGGFCPLNDAHFFGGVVFDIYQSWYGISPLTTKLELRVHYDNCYENAFWDGSGMTFGDGCNNFHPLVGLDIVAHEVSHGFTEQNSSLIYTGQSGGINEAFSDMAGEAAQFFVNGMTDFEVGAEIVKGEGALRYMYDPPLDGYSIGNAADFRRGMDVHNSSGVFNKAFYLLSTTEGWDVHTAFDCFVGANQHYWTPKSTFEEAAQGVVSECTDLGYVCSDVVAAFNGVGLLQGGSSDGIQLVSPADGAVLSFSSPIRPTFSWSSPAGYVFKIQVSGDSAFSTKKGILSIPRKGFSSSNTTDTLPDLAFNAFAQRVTKMAQRFVTIYWRVIGTSGKGSPLESSVVRSFTVQP